MEKSVKTLSLFTISLLFFSTSFGQLNFISQTNVSSDVKKLIEDFPNCFANLKGEIKVQNPQTTEYESDFKIEGSEESRIIIYTSKKKTICSWESLVLTTENFSEAKKKYKALYTQLKSSTNKLHLKGNYEEPKEEKKFASSVFSINSQDISSGKLKIEISLQYELMEWKVKLLVYDREREDDERGKTEDNK